ncbi:dephospho-CoA kinase [Gemmatimonadota bacterium]
MRRCDVPPLPSALPPFRLSAMLNVALTGNAAAGKSTVARWFADWGATIIDSDVLVAEVQQPGSETLVALARQFGKTIILSDGSLDRAALRRIVLADGNARATLNAIVHPAVQARRETLVTEARQRGDRILVSDIPLLFEVLDPDSFDLVVLVEAPNAIRRKRLVARGLGEDEAEQLMASQLPPEKKRARADIVIDNRGSLRELEEAAREAWKEIFAASDT